MHRRALVVDDDPAVCETLRKVLVSAGLEALTLTRSTEAASFLEEGKFDLVLLDLHMEAPDGIELARQMRESRSHRTTPIIFVSDDQRPSAMAIGFEAGANFFLYKPIDKNRFLNLIQATQGAMEHERRRTRRVPLQSKVRLKWGMQEMEGETVDVSLGGVLVKAPRTLPLGSQVRVDMSLSQRMRPIVGVGSVVRLLGGNQMGIQLDQLSVADSERLQEILLPMLPID